MSILLYSVPPCHQLYYCKNGREKNKTHILIMLQFGVTQSHVKQGAIAKKSSLLSQHETPHQLLNATGRSWSCGFKGTEQRMKGDSSHHFLARAACLSDPFSKSHFSLTIESFKLLLAEYLWQINCALWDFVYIKFRKQNRLSLSSDQNFLSQNFMNTLYISTAFQFPALLPWK